MKYLTLGVFLLIVGCSGSGEVVLDEAVRFQEMIQDIRVDGEDSISVDEALEHHGADGLTIVVFEDGVPVLLRGHYGYQDRTAGIETDDRTIYQAASLTKFVAGLAMAKAARQSNDFGLARKASKTAVDHPSSYVSAWVNAQFVHGVSAVTATQQISIRRLLKNAAGLNRPTTGTECARPSEATGLDDILSPVGPKLLKNVHTPGTEWKYSSGGFALAEAMLLAETGRDAEEFLETEILEPFDMEQSTVADASASMDHLARGCNAAPCACEVEYAEVKFPGGLLAHPLEYAAFLRDVMDVSLDGEERGGLTAEDVHEALKPAQHRSSSNLACSSDTQCPPGTSEMCHTGACIQPLTTGKEENSGGVAGGWYGMGVHLSPDRDVEGYSRTLHHLGGQDGVTTYFNVDRALQNGIVIMINGGPKEGRKALRGDLFDAFERHFR
jgi:CubicO group peptidase (beta-lactamase class C family)